jgi:uncharacterized protein (DUF427 family)
MTTPPTWILAHREGWKYRGNRRPPFAIEPRPGQESVWDYPRPPRIEPLRKQVLVRLTHTLIAESDRCVRVLETASAPTVYIPPDDVDQSLIVRGRGGSLCEWKGEAVYWTIRIGDRSIDNAGWSYAHPFAGFESIRDYVSFYPIKLECYVGDARVEPQGGGFYGGWVTPEIVGPMKGAPGTESW